MDSSRLAGKAALVTGGSRGIGRAICTALADAGADVAAALGRLDILVYNAGICPFAPFLDMTRETDERTRAVNLDGAFYCGQAAAQRMVQQGGGGKSCSSPRSVPQSLLRCRSITTPRTPDSTCSVAAWRLGAAR